MTRAPLYLDSSALVKLATPEPETAALLALLESWPERVCSALAVVELTRALRRAAMSPAVLQRADQILSRMTLIRIDDAILATAAILPPSSLRSLDAIHLATALSLGEDLGGLVTYDERLADAAARATLTVLRPA